MPWSSDTRATLKRLDRVTEQLDQAFSGRREVVELLRLAVVCHEHFLLLGPPGTAKSEVVATFASLCHARSFQYLLTRFSEPSELFGPMDVQAFQKGEYVVRTEGMLPTAEIAFLDEVFQGSSAILNTLLTLVHERRYHHGARRDAVPLISLFGASNELPDDPTLRAFSDRFVLRLVVEPVTDRELGQLVDRGWSLEKRRIEGGSLVAEPLVDPAELRALHRLLPTVGLGSVRPAFDDLIRQIRAQGVPLTDRRIVKSLKLVAGAALIAGREVASVADLWPLRHIWTELGSMAPLAEVVNARLAEAGGVQAGPRRTLVEVEAELGDLEQREKQLRSELVLGSHLRALGRLRQELVADHGEATATLARLDAAVGRLMSRLG